MQLKLYLSEFGVITHLNSRELLQEPVEYLMLSVAAEVLISSF
jgi:hypothetical protein